MAHASRAALLAAVVLVLPVAVLWPGVWGGFIFDDYPNLIDDDSWRLQQLGWAELMRVLGGGIASAAGRPLAMLSFAINHYLLGNEPWGFKVIALLWHAFNAVLLGWLLQQCLHLSGATARIGIPAVAGLAAVVWAIHPLQVSTVFYVVQRMEIGAATGVLLALNCYLKVRGASIAQRPVGMWLLMMAASVVLGFGFKETILLVPVYTLLLELCLLGFRGRGALAGHHLRRVYAIGLAVAVLVFVFLVLPRYGWVERYSGRDFGTVDRLLSQGPVLWMYLCQAVAAWPEWLRFYYDDQVAWMVSATWWQVALPWLGLAGLFGSAVALRSKLPLYALGIGWFFAGHLLTSNIWPLELAFEHRNYFPLAGLVLAATALALATGRRLTVGAGPAITLVLAGYVGAMGWLQASTWGDEDRLTLTLANRAQASERAGYALGQWLYRHSGGDPDGPLWAMAQQEMQRVAALPLSSGLPEHAVIVMVGRIGGDVPQGMWTSLRAKVARRELDAQTLAAVEGVAQCASGGQCRFADEASVQSLLLLALESSPHSDRLHARYGEYALARMGDRELAISLFRRAVELAPAEVVYRILLARVLLANGSDAELEEAGLIVAWVEAHDVYRSHAADIVQLQVALESSKGESR